MQPDCVILALSFGLALSGGVSGGEWRSSGGVWRVFTV